MKKITLSITILLLAGTTSAFADNSLEFCGFGDVYYALGTEDTDERGFEIGQVEIDVEAMIDDKVCIGGAVAYDPGTETFGLGAFTIDFHLFGGEGDHFRPSAALDHSGIIIGQFDVPFGIDWHVYPSIDRHLVSGPLVVEQTHDFWNDLGAQAYIEQKWLNAVVYGTNGFGYETIDTAGMPVEVAMKMAVGGRVGLTPHEAVEIGGSYAGFFDQDNSLDMSLMGIDLQLTYTGFSLKAEYIIHDIGQAGDTTISNSGFYGCGEYSFGNFFVTARYGIFSPDEEDTDDLTRLSAGAGWIVREGCELRFEYQNNTGEDNDAAFFQVAAGF